MVTSLKVEDVSDKLVDMHQDIREGNEGIRDVKKDVKTLVVRGTIRQ